MKALALVSSVLIMALVTGGYPQSASQDSSGGSAIPDSLPDAGRVVGFVVDPVILKGTLATDLLSHLDYLPITQSLNLGEIGQYSFISLRGAEPAAGSVLVDDFSLHEPIQGVVNPKYAPLNLIQSIEVAGHGEPPRFGLGYPGGVVNIGTYRFHGKRPYSKIVFRAGDFRYRDFGGLLGLPLSRSLTFLIDGNHQGFVFPDRSHDGYRFVGRLAYAPTPALDMQYTAFINGNDVEVSAPTIPNLAPGDTTSHWDESRFDQVLSLHINPGGGEGSEVRIQAYLTKTRQKSTVDTLAYDNRVLTPGVNLRYDLALGKQRLNLGGSFRSDDLNSKELGDHGDQLLQAFLGGDLTFSRNWHFRARLGLEKHDDFSLTFNHSLQLTYLLPSESSVWLGVQSGQRYPTFAERYWPSGYEGVASLKKEHNTAAEFGLSLKPLSKMRLQVSVFARNADDWIGSEITPDTLIVRPANLGSRTVGGVDMNLLWDGIAGGRIGIVASVMRVSQEASEEQLQTPEVDVRGYFETGRAFFEEYIFIRLRVTGRYIGNRTGIDFLTPDRVPRYAELKPTATLGGFISFEFKDARAVFSLENIFNTTYELVPGFPMPLQRFRFGIEWEFLD